MTWIANGIVSYAYIAYFLLLSGLLVQLNIISFRRSDNREEFVSKIILSSFVISLIINGVLGAATSLFDLGLNQVKTFLLILNGILVITLVVNTKRRGFPGFLRMPGAMDKVAGGIIAAIFLLMAVQGGLLDFMADGWWHMSIANRMVQENTLLLQYHPFVGVDSDDLNVFYPPLWHLQLALIQDASELSLPVIWHFIAAFNTALLLLSFYLLVSYLARDKKIALAAMVLHIFLVGGLNTYFRVASWPGNASYILLYFAIFLSFKLLDEINAESNGTEYRQILSRLIRQTSLVLILSCIGMLGLHGVELVLFVSSVGIYLYAIVLMDTKNKSVDFLLERKLLGLVFFVCLIGGIIAALILIPNHIQHVLNTPRAQDPYLNFIVPALTVIIGFIGALLGRLSLARVRKRVLMLIFFVGAGFFLYQITDFSHIRSLFFPETAGSHIPRDFFDRFDNRVFLPFWDHQLRGALLFSGLVSLVLSCLLPFVCKDRLNLFIGANSIFVLLVLTSPYFFTFMSFLIPLKSVYRVHILLFAPVIIASFVKWMFDIRSLRDSS